MIRELHWSGRLLRFLMPILLACGVLALPAQVQAQAQPYPAKPIHFIVPNPPGGGTDTLARLLANRLTERLGWQIVVENRPGAAGNVGLDIAARSAPDGYTIVIGETSNLAINPTLYANIPYDAARAFAPIALVGRVPLILVVSAATPYDSLAALVRAAKEKRMSYATAGTGTVGHLVTELWQRDAGIELLHVPYKGALPALTDLMSGQVDLFFSSVPAAMNLIKAGKLRALAVTSGERIAMVPAIATLIESGFPNFDISAWYGVLAPAGTPAPIVDRLNAEINAALTDEVLRRRLESDSVMVKAGTPEEFSRFMASERALWARAVKQSGAKVD